MVRGWFENGLSLIETYHKMKLQKNNLMDIQIVGMNCAILGGSFLEHAGSGAIQSRKIEFFGGGC